MFTMIRSQASMREEVGEAVLRVLLDVANCVFIFIVPVVEFKQGELVEQPKSEADNISVGESVGAIVSCNPK